MLLILWQNVKIENAIYVIFSANYGKQGNLKPPVFQFKFPKYLYPLGAIIALFFADFPLNFTVIRVFYQPEAVWLPGYLNFSKFFIRWQAY